MSKPQHNQRGQRQQPVQPQPNQVSVRQEWSGPLPPPAALERFNQIIPNGADRIVAMAEKEQAHRIDYEKTGLAATVREARRGQILGAIISAVAIGGAIFNTYIGGYWAVSVALVGVPVLGIVRAIV
jgi:uncharacterized membrane protein